MVNLTFPIAATVAAMIASLASTASSVVTHFAVQQAGCLRMYERFHLQSVSHGTYLVMEQATTNLMTGPGPLGEPPLVMCATASATIPCSANPPSICVPRISGSFIRVEFPNGSFGFLWGASDRPTIQVLPSPVQPTMFIVASNTSGGQTRMASVVSQFKMFQAGSYASGAPKPIVVEPQANVTSQLFNIVKLP
ncbi:MAG: hypothetical protein J3Q66DRAFT_367216 [Benniella sp.]|nr:MAG: hypothetical protein J3Q66DRAFT_367216 [Benniella sp.]